MNKGDLVNEVAKVVKTKKEAQAVVDCIFSTIIKALKKKDAVRLVGFGTFKVAERKARKGRNPQTGEEIEIKAMKVPKFVAGKALKDAVQNTSVKQNVRNMVGICGLYCGTCPRYLAYREDDVEQLEEISQETGIPIDQIRCDGCLSEVVFPLCVECRHGFRLCAAEKKVTWCFECQDFPCQRLLDFRYVHIVDGISHHANVIEELRYMKEHGIERWVEEQERAGLCPQCGKRLYWFVRRCPNCQTQVRR